MAGDDQPHLSQPDEGDGRDGSDSSATVCAEPEPPLKRRRTRSGSATSDEPRIKIEQPEPLPSIITVTFTIETKRESRSPSPSRIFSGTDAEASTSTSSAPDIEQPTPSRLSSSVSPPHAEQLSRPTTPRPRTSPFTLTDITSTMAPVPPEPAIVAMSVPLTPSVDVTPFHDGKGCMAWPEVRDFETCAVAAACTQDIIDHYLSAVESVILPLCSDENKDE